MEKSGHVFECLIVARPDAEALFRQHEDNTVTAHLDRYAVIPIELFAAMGGTDSPAYQEFVSSRGVSSLGNVTVPVGS